MMCKECGKKPAMKGSKMCKDCAMEEENAEETAAEGGVEEAKEAPMNWHEWAGEVLALGFKEITEKAGTSAGAKLGWQHRVRGGIKRAAGAYAGGARKVWGGAAGAAKRGAQAYGGAAKKVHGAVGRGVKTALTKSPSARAGKAGWKAGIGLAKAGMTKSPAARAGKAGWKAGAKFVKAGMTKSPSARAGKAAWGVAKRAPGAVKRGASAYGKAGKKVWGAAGRAAKRGASAYVRTAKRIYGRKEFFPVVTVKDQENKYRWTMVVSSAYGPDRDGEWLTEAALKGYAENFKPIRLTAKGEEPVVARWWHVGFPDPKTRSKGPGLDIGKVDTAVFHSKSLILSGTFDDPEIGEAFSKQENLGASLGFFHSPSEPVEKEFRSVPDVFEVSFLPVERASYPFTALAAVDKES